FLSINDVLDELKSSNENRERQLTDLSKHCGVHTKTCFLSINDVLDELKSSNENRERQLTDLSKHCGVH
ncbi:hypothetical protein, partial [Shigella sp. FC1967]|uniref:hypothetical protein n=1 Tax=Shigella sp. FC1967 TaxID=1898041 RepID=UPI001C0A6949